MPLQIKVIVVLVVIGVRCVPGQQVRNLRRQKRNLKHWEKGEPLEGVGDW